MKKSIWAEKSAFLDRFKSCFDTAKSKISINAAIPAKKYGFTKQKHIRGDKTLKIQNSVPKHWNIIQRLKPHAADPPKKEKEYIYIYILNKNNQNYQSQNCV